VADLAEEHDGGLDLHRLVLVRRYVVRRLQPPGDIGANRVGVRLAMWFEA
jgi:hypothetical protein